jgi:hypothetical protein
MYSTQRRKQQLAPKIKLERSENADPTQAIGENTTLSRE